MPLWLDRAAGRLATEDGRTFDPAARAWRAGGPAPAGVPVEPAEAARWLQRESGHPCRLPVAVVGPREATPDQRAAAEDLGVRLARLGVVVLCGGRQGVMEAVCRGAAAAGGVSVGLLPDDDTRHANPYVTIPIATGIGIARNALIARAGLCMVAVGGGYGTLAEIAFALQFGKPVFGLAGAPDVPGVRHLPDLPAAESAVAALLLGLPPG
ncbi:MAG TPA: TIGR00725 family protein [Thermodesulfobacteriota bacterium]